MCVGEDYFKDGALADQSGDEFHHRHYAEVLSDILLKSETPLNVGLCGKWGVGKSSIVHMLRERINKGGGLEGFEYAEVDAWGLSSESLLQGLLEELNANLGFPYNRKDLEDMLYNERQIQRTRLRSLKSGWWLVFAGIVAALPVVFLPYPTSINLAVLGGLATSVFALLVKMSSNTSSTTIPRVASARQFGDIYTQIVSKRGADKLVIVIDNLDRCEHAVAVKMLGLIQTFMMRDNCVNILACDDAALASHLKRSGAVRTEGDGNEFLSKFFQVTLRVPSFLGESLRSYAKKQIGKRSVKFDQFALTILLSGAIDNPRKINQFLNTGVALHRLAELREESGMLQAGLITGDTNSLLKSVVLRHEWPEFCKALEEDPGLYENGAKQTEWCKQMVADKAMTYNESERLLKFLNATQMPGASSIIPFLRIVQAPHIMEPGIAAFEDAFSRSDPEAVRMFKNLDSDGQDAYLYKVGEILRESASESDPNMPALLHNVTMLAKLIQEVPDSPVRTEMASVLGQHISGRMLIKARDVMERIGPDVLNSVPAHMRDLFCKNLVLGAFRADPPDSATLDTLSKNPAIISPSLAARMDEMAVDMIKDSESWDEHFIESCLKCRRKDARMTDLASHIISGATFGVSRPDSKYDRLCAELVPSLSADETEMLCSRIRDLATQCSDANSAVPPPLLRQIIEFGAGEQTCKAIGELVLVVPDRANGEILKIGAQNQSGQERRDLVRDVFAEYIKTAEAMDVIGLFAKPRYLRFLTTDAAIDSVLELCKSTKYEHPAIIRFLLTHTPDGRKTRVGSAFSDAIESENAAERGLLTAATKHSDEFDSDLIAAIMKSCLTKARKAKGPGMYKMYDYAARIGHERHVHEILEWAESLIRSADGESRCAGLRLLGTLNENRTEPLGIRQSIRAVGDIIGSEPDAVADHLEFLCDYGDKLAAWGEDVAGLLTACLDSRSRARINGGFRSFEHTTPPKDIADVAIRLVAKSGSAVQERMIGPMVAFVAGSPSKEAKAQCREILQKHEALLDATQKRSLAKIFGDF